MRSGQSRRAFAPAWLEGEAAAVRLLPAGFRRAADRVAAVRRAAGRSADPSLVAELASQHRGLPASAARERHLELLGNGGVAAVLTGQQVGLFTGPAFAIYKAVGAVAAARRLSEESGVPCVPVFWLQTEDHDWPEIDHCDVRGRDDRPVRVRLEGDSAPSRIPVASRRFDDGVTRALEQLAEEVGGRPFAAELLTLLRRHYIAGTSPADAFRGVMSELFCDDGLLLFDPRGERTASLVRPLFERAFLEAPSIAVSLSERAAVLATEGFAIQVPVRPDAPLGFFHPDGAAGPRYRLEARGELWRLCDSDREVSQRDVLESLRSDPTCVSSSALLRPLLQDSLFPTAMYLGGPGEIAYFAQLGPLYDKLGIEMPLVAPRPSFYVTEAGDRRRLEALGLGFGDLVGDRDEILSRISGAADGDIEHSLTAGFLASLEEFSQKALAVDANLAAPISRTRAAVEHSVARLAEKYRRSVAGRDSVLGRRLDALRAALAPGGVPQERCYGLASLAAQHGTKGWLDAARRKLEPFDGATREIAL